MLLYQDPRAPNPRRVRIFFAEKGVAYDTIEVLIATHGNLSPEFKKKNPLALLPVLELEDGRILRESIAICRYLEELYPDNNLFGNDPWERAVIEQWNRHAELEVFVPTMMVFRNTNAFWSGRVKQSAEWADITREMLLTRYDWLNHELGNREYIAGNRFTVADITTLCALDFAKVNKTRIDPATHPNLAAWHARVSARPSIVP